MRYKTRGKEITSLVLGDPKAGPLSLMALLIFLSFACPLPGPCPPPGWSPGNQVLAGLPETLEAQDSVTFDDVAQAGRRAEDAGTLEEHDLWGSSCSESYLVSGP